MKTSSMQFSDSKESEIMVLGSMLNSEYALNVAIEKLDESHFHSSDHKSIFQALNNLHANGKQADVELVTFELKRIGKFEGSGGTAYIMGLSQCAGTSVHIEEHVRILIEKATTRNILKILDDHQDDGNFEKTIFEIQEATKGYEKAKASQDNLSIRFLNEFDGNFLLDRPQKKEMLLETLDDGRLIGFLPKSIVAMLVGPGGLGKTHLAAQLAISIATGTPWLDCYTPKRKGNVFLGLGENQYDDIHRILYKAAKKIRPNQSDMDSNDLLNEALKRIAPYSFCGQQAAFIESGKPTSLFRKLKARLKECAPPGGWDFIMIDPLSRVSGADAETDNAAATKLIALFEELSMELPGNPTILLVHHVNKTAIQQGSKQDQSAARGSSALTDGVRWQLNLSRNDAGERILKMTKSNFTALAEEIKLRGDEEGFLERSLEQSISEKGKLTTCKPKRGTKRAAFLDEEVNNGSY